MQTAIKIIIGLICAIAAIWFCLWLTSPNDDTRKDIYYSQSVIDSLALENEYAKSERDKFKDSLFGLHVEKGFLEVQLNKSKSELDRLLTKHDHAKIIHDTTEIVQNCDSIIAELKGRYIPLSDSVQIYWLQIDSVNHNLDEKVDTILTTDAAIYKLKDNQVDVLIQQNESKPKKKRKIPIISALVGFIAGVLTVIAISK